MKTIQVSGKRKTAIARASVKEGNGRIRINKVPLDILTPEYKRLRIMEPVLLAEDAYKKVDIDVNVISGGVSSQAEAARLVVAKGIAEFTKSTRIRETLLKYDRSLLVADVRRKETHKPNRLGKARSKRQKSYR